MMPMRRRTSSVVIAAAPRAGGCCRWAATGTVSTASSRFRRYRITRGLEKGSEPTNAPGYGGVRTGLHGPAARDALVARVGPEDQAGVHARGDGPGPGHARRRPDRRRRAGAAAARRAVR